MGILLLDLLIQFFISQLSAERCIKLYAALLISDDRQLSRKAALDKAYFSKTTDLRRKLRHLIEYGPN